MTQKRSLIYSIKLSRSSAQTHYHYIPLWAGRNVALEQVASGSHPYSNSTDWEAQNAVDGRLAPDGSSLDHPEDSCSQIPSGSKNPSLRVDFRVPVEIYKMVIYKMDVSSGKSTSERRGGGGGGGGEQGMSILRILRIYGLLPRYPNIFFFFFFFFFGGGC